jgi:glycosyltransferase involved in cell wall biosynthesis
LAVTQVAGRKGAKVTSKRIGHRAARRVLVVGPVPPPLHGVTVMTAALLDALHDSAWQVVRVDTSDHRSIDNIGRFDLGNVVFALRHAARFTRTLLRTRPDIVYLPLSQGVAGFTRDAVFLVAARLSAAQVVVHAHGALYQEFYRRMPAAVRGLMRFSMGRVRMIIVLAEAQRRQFEGWAPRRARIEVIPNGVRDEWSTGIPRRLPQEGGTVLFLGNLLPQKGFLDVLDAVPMVLRMVPGARFVFAGRPAWNEAMTALVSATLREPNVEQSTTFAGVVGPAERRTLLEGADVLVFPPQRNEGQGLVALEAMSAGLPLVVTASGGLAETVHDDVEAIIVPKQDPQAVAAAVTRLLQDSGLRARMGAAARERFESEYTLVRWESRMIEAFEAAAEPASGCR